MKHVKLLEAFEEEIQQGMQPEAFDPMGETGPLAVVSSYLIKGPGREEFVEIAYFTSMGSAMKKFMQVVEDIEKYAKNPKTEAIVYICRLKEGDKFDYTRRGDDHFGDPYNVKDVILSYDPSSPNKYVEGF